jgi:hypothetical protein
MKLGYVKLRRILIGQAMSICLRLDPGCNPAPGAWTNYGERKLYLFEARNIVAGTFGMVRVRKIGEWSPRGDAGLRIPRARRLRRGLSGAPRQRAQDQIDGSRHSGRLADRGRHTPLTLGRETRTQRALNVDVACSGLPAQVAGHRTTHHALPALPLEKQRDGPLDRRRQRAQSVRICSRVHAGACRGRAPGSSPPSSCCPAVVGCRMRYSLPRDSRSRFMRPRRVNGGVGCDPIIAFDPLPSRLGLARELGATREDFGRDLRQLVMDDEV